jgi:hypothetical protein
VKNEPKSGKSKDVDMGRRGLWKQLLGRAVVWQGEVRGHRHLALSELEQMPDAMLAEVVPVFRQDGGFRLEGGRLFSDSGDPEKRQCVCECSDEEIYVLGRFDSGTPLGDIGTEVENLFHLPKGHGFELTRDLFLELAKSVICHPAGMNEA